MVNQIYNRIPELVQSYIEKNNNSFEMTVLTLIRMLKKEDSNISAKLESILSNYQSGVKSEKYLRSIPRNQEELHLIREVVPKNQFNDLIFSKEIEEDIQDILNSHLNKKMLLEHNLHPINKIILSGEPGTGKTSFAEALAHELDLPFYVIDLSAIFSRYLGNTGKNITSILEYIKNLHAVCLIDEFDAIGISRTSEDEIGEVKRVVNILLKELEDWDSECILLAATNNPELLDKAIWRRFDLKINMGTLNTKMRMSLWKKYLRGEVSDEYILFLSEVIPKISPADIKSVSEQALIKKIISNYSIEKNILEKCKDLISFEKKDLVKKIRHHLGRTISQKEIAKLTNVSESTVSRYLDDGVGENEK